MDEDISQMEKIEHVHVGGEPGGSLFPPSSLSSRYERMNVANKLLAMCSGEQEPDLHHCRHLGMCVET